MNRQIVHLFGLSLLLFSTLVVSTSWSTVFGSEGLRDNERLNRRALIEQQQVPRGLILARDGTVLARSEPRGRGLQRTFSRTYPTGPLFSHAVGYSYVSVGQAGLEQFYNDELTGEQNEFGTLFSELQGRAQEGNDITTTLDPEAQQVAQQALGGQNGSVVAIEPQTGRVRVMVSVPEFDANTIADGGAIESFNRATQSSYPPGSTFKVVTAAAALDSGKLTPDSVIDGSSPRIVSGAPLSNSGGADFGPITLTDALTNSVNTVFAQVGEQIGPETLVRYMERFGFYRDPQLDYPDEQMLASGIRNSDGELVKADGGFDIGRVSIGQGGEEGTTLVTPLQMALVAAAVGNDGTLMRPRLVEKVLDRDGRVVERVEPEEQNQVISEDSAAQLQSMMTDVVNEGTGTAAALSDVSVGGKTGTAEVDNATSNQAWFIAFAPVEDPQIAIAVTVERTTGQGGTVAAPIAAQVIQELLQG